MSLNLALTQSAADRKSVQGNATVYFAGSQEYLDDRQAQLDALILQDCSNKANLISQWCSCANYKDVMGQEDQLTLHVGFVDGNLLSTWESDLTNQGFIVSFSGTGNLTGTSADPDHRFPVDLSMTITLP